MGKEAQCRPLPAPRNQVQNLKSAIAGYKRFVKRSQAYADIIIQRPRSAQNPQF